MRRREAEKEIEKIMQRRPSTDHRLFDLTLDQICALALRQLETDTSKPDKDKRIEKIKKRLAAITDGPWYAGKKRTDDNGISQSISVGAFEADEHYEDTICEVWDGNHVAKANADFIANAPADIAYLLGIDL